MTNSWRIRSRTGCRAPRRRPVGYRSGRRQGTWSLAVAHGAATCSVLTGCRLMIRPAYQQPSYGAHGEVPSWAYAVANTWFCSATDAFPKSAGLTPAETQAE